MDLDGAATELYGLDPDEFMAARTALVTQARAAGDRALASAIGALRKPTRSAWLVNLLARETPEGLQRLDELAGRMAVAHQGLDLAALRALGAERQRLVDALTADAVAAGSARGYQATEAVRSEISQTLSAAIADPQSRSAVVAGGVVRAQVYSGFGLPVASPPPTRAADRSAPAGEPPSDLDAARQASDAARRRAREAMDAATAALTQARAELTTAQTADAEAHQRLDRAAHEVADLRAELRAAEAAEVVARDRANEASDQLHEARGAVQQAEQALSGAARALTDTA